MPCEPMQKASVAKRVEDCDIARLQANKMKDGRCYESLPETPE